MAEDREVLREVWEGRLPVCFSLASEEVHSPLAPDPFYMMVPRITYFPLVTDKARRHFSRHVHPDKQDNEIWLEFEGQALKWHYPIGALFDSLARDQPLPWQVTIHFDKYPEKLMKSPSRDIVESHWMTCVKEADAMKHKTQVMSLMQKRDHNQMWMGLLNDKFDQFWSVNHKLMESQNDEGFRYIPFRLFVPDLSGRPFLQCLMKPVNEEGQHNTLRHLINQTAPSLLDKGPFQIITHGIDVPLETPLQWMSEHLSYPDNFLHLSVYFPS